MGSYTVESTHRFREWRLFGRRFFMVHEGGFLGHVIFFDSDQTGVTAAATSQLSQRPKLVKALRLLADQMERETVALNGHVEKGDPGVPE